MQTSCMLTCFHAFITTCLLYICILAYLHNSILARFLYSQTCILACLQTWKLIFMHTCIPNDSMYTRMHTCIHLFMHTCIHLNMHTCIHLYMHTCILAYLHTCIHAYKYTCIHAYMRTCIHAHMHTCHTANMACPPPLQNLSPPTSTFGPLTKNYPCPARESLVLVLFHYK